MGSYIKFWLAKQLVEVGIPLGIFAAIFAVTFVVMLIKAKRRRSTR